MRNRSFGHDNRLIQLDEWLAALDAVGIPTRQHFADVHAARRRAGKLTSYARTHADAPPANRAQALRAFVNDPPIDYDTALARLSNISAGNSDVNRDDVQALFEEAERLAEATIWPRFAAHRDDLETLLREAHGRISGSILDQATHLPDGIHNETHAARHGYTDQFAELLALAQQWDLLTTLVGQLVEFGIIVPHDSIGNLERYTPADFIVEDANEYARARRGKQLVPGIIDGLQATTPHFDLHPTARDPHSRADQDPQHMQIGNPEAVQHHAHVARGKLPVRPDVSTLLR